MTSTNSLQARPTICVHGVPLDDPCIKCDPDVHPLDCSLEEYFKAKEESLTHERHPFAQAVMEAYLRQKAEDEMAAEDIPFSARLTQDQAHALRARSTYANEACAAETVPSSPWREAHANVSRALDYLDTTIAALSDKLDPVLKAPYPHDVQAKGVLKEEPSWVVSCAQNYNDRIQEICDRLWNLINRCDL